MKFVIVDDDLFILELMRLALESVGHDVTAFESSVFALRRSEEHTSELQSR